MEKRYTITKECCDDLMSLLHRLSATFTQGRNNKKPIDDDAPTSSQMYQWVAFAEIAKIDDITTTK